MTRLVLAYVLLAFFQLDITQVKQAIDGFVKTSSGSKALKSLNVLLCSYTGSTIANCIGHCIAKIHPTLQDQLKLRAAAEPSMNIVSLLTDSDLVIDGGMMKFLYETNSVVVGDGDGFAFTKELVRSTPELASFFKCGLGMERYEAIMADSSKKFLEMRLFGIDAWEVSAALDKCLDQYEDRDSVKQLILGGPGHPLAKLATDATQALVELLITRSLSVILSPAYVDAQQSCSYDRLIIHAFVITENSRVDITADTTTSCSWLIRENRLCIWVQSHMVRLGLATANWPVNANIGSLIRDAAVQELVRAELNAYREHRGWAALTQDTLLTLFEPFWQRHVQAFLKIMNSRRPLPARLGMYAGLIAAGGSGHDDVHCIKQTFEDHFRDVFRRLQAVKASPVGTGTNHRYHTIP